MTPSEGIPEIPDLGRIVPKRLTGAEPLHDRGTPIGGSVLDFWQWAGSDLIANTFRGWVAEYIVARALGTAKGVRQDWLAYDLEAGELKIEVKSSAYAQSWVQKTNPPRSSRFARAGRGTRTRIP